MKRCVSYLLAQRGQHSMACGSMAFHRAVGETKTPWQIKKHADLKRNINVKSHFLGIFLTSHILILSAFSKTVQWDTARLSKKLDGSLYFPSQHWLSPGNRPLLINPTPHSSAVFDLWPSVTWGVNLRHTVDGLLLMHAGNVVVIIGACDRGFLPGWPLVQSSMPIEEKNQMNATGMTPSPKQLKRGRTTHNPLCSIHMSSFSSEEDSASKSLSPSILHHT